MCGVNGVYAFSDAARGVSAAEIVATRDQMAARGPDGAGLWIAPSGRVGLGHRRLSIIDPSPRADQPMRSADGRYALAFNGEIYNHREIRRELAAEGATFQTASDTEAILALYARRGPRGLAALRGMYALAIWDGAAEALLLARDPYGIKSLYVACDGWTFRFASQVKALLAGGGVSRAPEPAGLTGFALFGSVPEPFTAYRDIRALPAGAVQWVDRDGPRAPDVSAPLAGLWRPCLGAPTRDLAQTVAAAARESVAAHLVSDVEVGVFLSAGIDSGAVLGLMRDAGAERVRAITVAFDDPTGAELDEAPLAAETARAYGAEHVVRRVGREEFEADLPAILAAMDQPSIDGINSWFVAKAAREVGLKTALSGVGGDELLAGYPSFVDMPRWRRFGAPALATAFGPFWRAAATVSGLARRRPKLAGFAAHAGSWAGAYLLRRGLWLPQELPALLGAETAREGLARLDLTSLLDGLRAGLPSGAPGAAVVGAMESGGYLRWTLLRDADWAGMAHSVEIRTPLVDRRLAETMAPLAAACLGGAGKDALARAPSRPLPEAVRVRAKTGFNAPLGAWTAPREAAAQGAAPRGLASRRWARAVLAAHLAEAAGSPAEIADRRGAIWEAAA